MTAPKAQQDAPWICLGKITKPFGIRGGVRIHLYNPDSETLQPGLNVELRHAASNKSIEQFDESICEYILLPLLSKQSLVSILIRSILVIC